MNKRKLKHKISRIKANAYDSAAFDHKSQMTFTWGSFGALRLQSTRRGIKQKQLTPKPVKLHLMQETVQEINFDDNTIYSDTEWQIKKMFAVPETNDGKYTIPGEEG